MPKKMKRGRKALVIDACIVRSASDNDECPQSKNCRDILMAILDICHHMAMTPDLWLEWNKHRSRWSSRWLASMLARKKIDDLSEEEVEKNVELRKKILKQANAGKDKAAVKKDLLLIEAALKRDKIIISRDDIVKNLFEEIANSVGEIHDIAWVNPMDNPEKSRLWLENGARRNKSIQLKKD